MNKSIKFLDCTLRDGGYYNNWDFSLDLIKSYIDSVSRVGVDVIELGFRSKKQDRYRGACAYTTDDFIASLNVVTHVKFGVMVDAHEILIDKKVSKKILSDLFPLSASQSSISLVRIACKPSQIHLMLDAVNWLKSKEYMVALNLMQISTLEQQQVVSIIRKICHFPVDVLYFADSLGSMTPYEVSDFMKTTHSLWNGDTGIHAHNNMGNAIQNTLSAMSSGCIWLDSTVSGIGRGAGNAKTELLAIELAEVRGVKLDIIYLISFIKDTLEPELKNSHLTHEVFYYLSGKYGIHPSYIQEMLIDERYDVEDILCVIDQLRQNGGGNYSKKRLGIAHYFYSEIPGGTWDPKILFNDKEVLLLGSGPGIVKHRSALEAYIYKCKPLVVALNAHSNIDEKLINVRVASHPIRLLSDSGKLSQISKPLITPVSMLPKHIKDTLLNIDLFDYGLAVQVDKKTIYEDNYCVLSNSLAASYCFAIASSGNAKRVLLAGFDGYREGDLRQIEMNHTIALHQEVENSISLISITPTTYNINSISIYALLQ